MKKFLLSLSLFAMTLMASAQEPTLKARSIYDVNQDDKVTVQDVPALANKLLGKAADKTAVDTQSLLDVLNNLTKQYEKILSELAELKAKQCSCTCSGEGGSTADAHEYVDLGLPSGTLWATCNVGAENPEDYGLYFAWGETVGYGSDTSDGRQFDWVPYKWMDHSINSWKGCQKYTYADNKTDGCWYSGSTYVGTMVDGKTYKTLTKLESADDAATANWGSDWCMPTHAQQEELVNSSYTTTEWTTLNGVYGRKITSKVSGYTGNYIFLPAAGYRYGSSLNYAGSYGYYWSSELGSLDSFDAWRLDIESSYVRTDYRGYRFLGQSVRAVRCSASE